ncbi:hypothetical protein BP6252_00657 [Coleophoma cylindrospora]|uniref:JmjC domain-containing protein n=1 Tax=Coleophoma cylindrospora TaxID=1849047 RepID=A0A3D8SQN6_9HELO|nr:hypothetical protein BP6252_00657 [Coleophoma cylindrospora]
MADTDLNSEADPIAELLISYDELNSPHIDVFDEVPSALEFLRYVARNRPFVVRGGASDWKATRTWNVSTLKRLLKDEKVNVALTPKGHVSHLLKNADSPTLNDQGELVFVKPWEEEQSFDTFLDFVTRQELSSHDLSDAPREDEEIRYAQTQNDNLRNEYLTLFADVEKEIPWARIALQHNPEAINLWIGNSRSVTAMHKDNYENIYCQIIGQKHFVLLPPLAFPCINEQELQPAIYEKEGGGLRMKIEEGAPKVPFAIWDPDRPTENTTEYSHLANPMRVTLDSGDMLYLPALWYHKVSQSCSEEGLCCAVNYWHDMDFAGSFYPLCDLVRGVTLAKSQQSGSNGLQPK